ncbi:DUF4856 domain-containing protein [Pleionea sediminis]|uniref:DUF4856 domain-containing protein n=1 Tax=Pleionea sediminis TaxID=2569479 RepID=UPI0011864997|nr:DUF4856 domain-containing protein [Pleionea sediminis]
MPKKLLISSAITTTLLAVTACGGSSSSSNKAPTDIQISANQIDENTAGAIVGTLTAVDPNSNDTFTFTTTHDSFEIINSTLKLKTGIALNYEKTSALEVPLTVFDQDGLNFSKLVTIEVNDLLDTYKFTNSEGESTVSYSGQITRMVLIEELNQFIGSELQSQLETGALTSRQEVMNKLNSFYEISSEDYDLVADTFMVDFIEAAEQTNLRQLSSSKKDLFGKIAGNDPVGQHKDWNNGDFEGWGIAGSTTPHELVQTFFGMLADNAQTYLDGNTRTDFNGNEITQIYLTEDGRDLKQLIQKFLLGAVAFSQGTDDYLDDGTDGKGLETTNILGDDIYTTLEHQWDEGYGYFGAARDYLEYTDDEIAGKGGREEYSSGRHDSDGNGEFDLNSEVNFGNSVNAAKRDRGTSELTVPTDFSTNAFNALLNGRKIINDNVGAELTNEQMTELQAQRDIVVEYWEKSISATVIHYINDTLADLNSLETAEFDYSNLAKHWSEMKGFALNLQFNPHSPLTDAQFTELHSLLQDAPVVSEADIEQYKTDLMTARGILESAYGFDSENVANW